MDNLNFGALTSATIVPNTLSTTGTFRADCSGSRSATVRVCIDFDGGTGGSESAGLYRLMPNSTATSAFRITLIESTSRTTWGSAGAATYPAPVLDMAAVGGAASGSLNASATIDSLIAPPSAGFYTTRVRATLRYGASSSPCAQLPNTARLSFTMRANVRPSCSLNADPLNFGAVFALDNASDARTSIYLTCTNGSPYTVTLNNGLNGTSAAQRVMKSGTATVTYALYADASMRQLWGNGTSAAGVSGTGTGSQQVLSVYGRIPGGQNPPSGSYTDLVIINVTF